MGMKDMLLVVDENDNVLRMEEKEKCHDGDGIPHRAISVFIFNSKNQLLIQQRSELKRLWPLFWSNSCCSHPRKEESYKKAAERRVFEELGISCNLRYLYKFRYQVPYKDIGSENEMCAVLVGWHDGEVRPDPEEIADWKFVDVDELVGDIKKNPDKYTPWFKMEMERLRGDHEEVFSGKT